MSIQNCLEQIGVTKQEYEQLLGKCQNCQLFSDKYEKSACASRWMPETRKSDDNWECPSDDVGGLPDGK